MLKIFHAIVVTNRLSGRGLMCVFTNSMASYLSKSYISQYPIDLLTIGDTSQNTYPLARKLAMHFTMLRNVSRGTNDILKVSKLLENTPIYLVSKK